MPDLDYQIVGVEPAARGLTPLLSFRLRLAQASEAVPVQAVVLNAQIQVQPAQRAYTAPERQRLVELFGTPERWGQTLRSFLWTHANINVGRISGSTEVNLWVPCTYDLNIASAKYFYALENGEVSLRFLFSGSVFYTAPGGALQVERVPWDKECVYRMPVERWRAVMDQHFPNSAWLALRRDAFERLCAYKRDHGFATWDQAIDSLLPAASAPVSDCFNPEAAEVPT